jgi:GAF domain-containing protein
MPNKNVHRQTLLVRLASHPDIARGRLPSAFHLLTDSLVEALELDRATVWQLALEENLLTCLDVCARSAPGGPAPGGSAPSRTAAGEQAGDEQARGGQTCGAVRDLSGCPDLIAAFISQRAVEWSGGLLPGPGLPGPAAGGPTPGSSWAALDPTQPPRAALLIPLRLAGRVEGILALEMLSRPRRWSKDDAAFACQAADLAAQCLLNAELRVRDQHLTMLSGALRELANEYRLANVLAKIVDHAMRLAEGHAAQLFLCDPDRQDLRCVTSCGQTACAGQTLKFGEDAAGIVAETGRALIVDDYAQWERRTPFFEAAGAATLIAIPILVRRQVTAVLQVSRRAPAEPFSPALTERLALAAQPAAVAIDHARLLEKTADYQDLHRTLNQITSTAAFAPELADILETVLSYLLHALQGSALGAAQGTAQGAARGTLRGAPSSALRGALRIHAESSHRGLPAAAPEALFCLLQAANPPLFTTLTLPALPGHALIAAQASLAADLEALLGPLGVQSALIVPIFDSENDRPAEPAAGFCLVAAPSAHTWTREEISLVEIAARQAGLAGSRLLAQESAAQQQNLLVRLKTNSETLNRLFTFDDAVTAIGRGTLALLNPDRAALYLRSPDGTIQCAWNYGLPREHILRLQAQAALASQLFLGGPRPTVVPDLANTAPDAPLRLFFAGDDARALGLWPLIYESQTVGCLACFSKQPRAWTPAEVMAMQTFSGEAALTLQNAWLFEQVDSGYKEIALALAAAAEAREARAPQYVDRLTAWVESIGRQFDLGEDELADLRWAARLRDIGKTSVPAGLLEKPGPLTPDELQVLHRYPRRSGELVQVLPNFHNVSAILRSCREHFDGQGYPDGLKGSQIPLGGRILAVADSFGAMIDARPYRKALSFTEAVGELLRQRGRQFDPLVVDRFLLSQQVEVTAA